MGQRYNKKYDDPALYKGPEYKSWDQMKQRCLNPKATQFSDYGGRGIKIYKPWLEFTNFIKDMGRKPALSYTLDRIDNDGDYEPSNCRWATRSEQMINQRMRTNNKSGYRGVHYIPRIRRWRAEIQYQKHTVTLGSYPTPDEAAYVRDQVFSQLTGSNKGLNFEL